MPQSTTAGFTFRKPNSVRCSPNVLSAGCTRIAANARGQEAGRMIAHEYRRTTSEKVHVVYGYVEHDLISTVFTNEGPDPEGIRYAEAALDPKTGQFEFNMSFEGWNEVCPDDGTRLNVTPAVEDGVAKGEQ